MRIEKLSDNIPSERSKKIIFWFKYSDQKKKQKFFGLVATLDEGLVTHANVETPFMEIAA